MRELVRINGITVTRDEAGFLQPDREILSIKFHRGSDGILNAIEVRSQKRARGIFARLFPDKPPIAGEYGMLDLVPSPAFIEWAEEMTQTLNLNEPKRVLDPPRRR